MICPNCKALVTAKDKVCPKCGMQFNDEVSVPQGGVQRGFTGSQRTVASNGGLMLGAAARAARLKADYSDAKILETRTYNLIIAAVVLYGLVVNALICNFVGDIHDYIDPLLFLGIYLVMSFAGVIIAGKSQKPAISFLGYNMLVVPLGLVISTLVAGYLEVDTRIVTDAFLYTLLIVLVMGGAAVAFPKIFAKMGTALLIALIASLVLGAVLMLLGVDDFILDVIVAGIFSLYIGYDIYRSQQFPKTVDNAIDSALDIYLDIANLFVRLLAIIARSKSRD